MERLKRQWPRGNARRSRRRRWLYVEKTNRPAAPVNAELPLSVNLFAGAYRFSHPDLWHSPSHDRRDLANLRH